MAGTLIWHDRRLLGYPDPTSADEIVSVDGSTDLMRTIVRIGNFANGRGGVDQLTIMCHGFMQVHESESEQRSTIIGGGGLQLCQQNVALRNVAHLAQLHGLIGTIVVHACGAAHTHRDKVGTRWDGQRLFGEMALHTGAEVYAADVTQYYWRLRNASPNTCTDIIDFRGWEGNLWHFSPDGRSATLVESNPYSPR